MKGSFWSSGIRAVVKVFGEVLFVLFLLWLGGCGIHFDKQAPEWEVNPEALSFSGVVGDAAPASQEFTLRNVGNGEGDFTISVDQAWIHVVPRSGSLAAGGSTTIQVSVDACTVAGTDNGAITISGGESTARVTVTRSCEEPPAPEWVVSPISLNFSGIVGDGTLEAQTFVLQNIGDIASDFEVSSDRSWVHVSPNSGSLAVGESISIQVSVDACMEVGSESGEVLINGGGSVARVIVKRDCSEPLNAPPVIDTLKLQTNADAQASGVNCGPEDIVVAGDNSGYILVSASDPDGDNLVEYRFRIDDEAWSTTSLGKKYWYEPNNDTHKVDVQVVDSQGKVSDIVSCLFRVSYTPQIVDYSGPNGVDVSTSIQSFDAWITDLDFNYPKNVYIEIYNEDTGQCLTNNGPWIPCGENASRVSSWDSEGRVHYQYLVSSSWPEGTYSYRFTVIDSYGIFTSQTPKKYFIVH